MEEDRQKYSTLGVAAIVTGIMSFIPLVGILIGIIAIVLGVIALGYKKSKAGIGAIILGLIGISITVGIYGSLFYYGFQQHGGVFDDMRASMISEQLLPDTVNTIEAYKGRFGQYPASIEDLNEISNNPEIITDQFQIINTAFGKDSSKDLYYYYQKKGNGYYLFSRGRDGKPFTEDDIYPEIPGDIGKTGYREP